MNQGLYHPSFNANGAAKASDDKYWHDTTQTFTSQADCFNPAKLLAGSGSIASGKSGRPSGDNLYYDAIYSSGAGGVCRDMRYSAYGVDSVDFAEADQKVKNGTYRGFELLPCVSVIFSNIVPSDVSSWLKLNISGMSGDFSRFDKNVNKFSNYGSVVSSDGVAYKVVRAYKPNVNELWLATIENTTWPSNKTWSGCLGVPIPTSVGGSFLQTDVIGNPANILATPQLANGWQGSWIPVIPDEVRKFYTFTRKVLGLSSSLGVVYTDNNGTSWVYTIWGSQISVERNGATSPIPSGRVVITSYQAFAKQTEPANNAVVYGYKDGVGQVFQSGGYFTPVWGNLLMESLLGIVGISFIGGTGGSHIGVTSITIRPDVYTLNGSGADGSVSHQSVTKGAPANNSSGFKALDYNVNINQQAFIQYAYTELKHNGTNWGDDGKVTIVDNQATKTDLNGNTVLVGTAKLKEPLGWVKNSK